uniref:Uncharacterized protein n=1 Tax=viral metagenome TaxID=1070528 RepID=A0A6C0B7Z7_9ZZZZ
MGFFKYINIPVFVISLILGMIAVYYTVPDSRTVYVYPTPENINLLQYKDKTDSCFSFEQKEVQCPKNPDEIAKIPVQS